ncbi:MAG: metallophosphoesterase family protein [Micromonosporaceae bacterium]
MRRSGILIMVGALLLATVAAVLVRYGRPAASQTADGGALVSTPPNGQPANGAPDAVLLAAGDIASCSSSGDETTARLLDGLAGTIAALGDLAYQNGSATDFARCFDPTWGRFRARIRPAIGNHEYGSADAAPYFRYFGPAAGEPGRGYYSYDLGAWHVVVLNSNCGLVGCQAGSAQERWLRADLAASPRACTLAYWHHPLFTSGANHPGEVRMRPLFQALYDAGAEVVLTGHNHNYERFAPQSPTGAADPSRGIREFVVGTGGGGRYAFGAVQPNSEVRDHSAYGVLRLTLHATSYDWQFVPEPGNDFHDSGTSACH